MSLKEDIADQEQRKKDMKNVFKVKPMPKMRANTRQRIEQAEKAQGKLIMEALHDGKRTIPSDWQRGYNAAMSIAAQVIDAKK